LTRHSGLKVLSLAVILVALGGCQTIDKAEADGTLVRDFPSSSGPDRNPRKYDDQSRAGNSLRDLIRGGGGSDANSLPVNKYLWRASLDTLSFLPLASTDPFSGVIATEWGASPEAPNERVRVTAYVEGKELSARALDVSVFRETLNASGAWTAATVNPQTAEQVKDKILLRARELRIQDIDGPPA